MKKKLYRSCDNRMLWGVCGGLAEYFNIRPSRVRTIAVLLVSVIPFIPMLFRRIFSSDSLYHAIMDSFFYISIAIIIAYIVLSIVIPLQSSDSKESDRDRALKITIIPMLVIFFIVGLGVESWGPPDWVEKVLVVGFIYWLITVLALIFFTVKRQWHRAKWIAIGDGYGFLLLLVSAGMCL